VLCGAVRTILSIAKVIELAEALAIPHQRPARGVAALTMSSEREFDKRETPARNGEGSNISGITLPGLTTHACR
jgi:hypothetical protein